MEYVFGLDDVRGQRTLLTRGDAHTDLTGFCEVVREYDDCTITDNFRIVRKLDSAEGAAGDCYDWYDIDQHYRTIDKTKGVRAEVSTLAADTTETRVAAMAFAATATELTDAQALEMPGLFPKWETVLAAGELIKCGRIIDDGGTLYRVVPSDGVTPQAHQPPHGEGMLAVYRPVAPEHAGTAEDPIPWVYGMDCYEGKYYSYEGHVYKVAVGGSMIPCVWTPGTAGLWQWELIE